MVVLREYWFQVLLAMAGIMVGFVGSNSDAMARKIWLTMGALFFFLATVSYIWGDPVRGPFYGLTSPHASDEFNLHAGMKARFTIRNLSTGIDLGRAIKFGNNPISLTVKRTWWSGWEYKISLRLEATMPIIEITNSKISNLRSDWDFNHDETAVEIVDQDGQPRFQVVQSLDNDVLVNAMLIEGGSFTIMNGERFLYNWDLNSYKDKYEKNKLTPLFKYPSYRNLGRRE